MPSPASNSRCQVAALAFHLVALIFGCVDSVNAAEITLHGPFAEELRFSRDGQRLLVGAKKTARVWDTSTWKQVGQTIALGDLVYHWEIDADGSRMLTLQDVVRPAKPAADIKDLEWEHEYRIWDIASGKTVRPAVRFQLGIGGPIPNLGGNLIAVAVDENTVQVSDARTGQKMRSFKHEQQIEHYHLDAKGSTLVIVDVSGNLRVWNVKSGKLQSSSQIGYFFMFHGHANGRLLVRTISGFKVFEIATGKLVFEYEQYYKYDIDAMVLSPDGKYVAIDHKEQAEIWHLDSGKRMKSVPVDDHAVFAPQGEVLAMTFSDQPGLWDFKTGTWIQRFDPKAFGFGPVAFSPDGKYFAMAGADRIKVIKANAKETGANRWK